MIGSSTDYPSATGSILTHSQNLEIVDYARRTARGPSSPATFAQDDDGGQKAATNEAPDLRNLNLHNTRKPPRRFPISALTLAALLFTGCDPVVNIAGANFPAWLICAIAGIALATVARAMFAAARIEPHLGPLTLVYPCLALLLSCVVWMIFFNRI
jgi:hypothetical protein